MKMLKKTQWVLFLMVVVWFFSVGIVLAKVRGESMVASGNNEFAVSLYKEIAKNHRGKNIFFSPFSITSALAMTYAGARGKTALEMEKVLRFPFTGIKLHKAYHSLMADINSRKSKNIQMDIANRLWGQKGYSFLDSFVRVTKDYYGAALEQLNFAKNPEGSRAIINKWVEKKTHGKIKDLLPPRSITPATTLVLTNAIYFKGIWNEKFDPKNTEKAPFHLSNGKKVPVKMMYQKGYFPYASVKNVKILKLYFAGKTLSMVFVLPEKGVSLDEVEKNLTDRKLKEYMSNLRREKVKVFIPRFKVEEGYNLGPYLKQMGMVSPFISSADFSGMTGNRELYISLVIHKAFVEVKEEGSEAAASTAVVMTRAMAPRHREECVFRADHPFIFLIRDEKTGAILFLGRLEKPV